MCAKIRSDVGPPYRLRLFVTIIGSAVLKALKLRFCCKETTGPPASTLERTTNSHHLDLSISQNVLDYDSCQPICLFPVLIATMADMNTLDAERFPFPSQLVKLASDFFAGFTHGHSSEGAE
jgi:hypothetical protein